MNSSILSRLVEAVAIAISVALIARIFSKVSLTEVISSFQQSNLLWLLLALVLYWMEIGLRVVRWKRLLLCTDSVEAAIYSVPIIRCGIHP